MAEFNFFSLSLFGLGGLHYHKHNASEPEPVRGPIAPLASAEETMVVPRYHYVSLTGERVACRLGPPRDEKEASLPLVSDLVEKDVIASLKVGVRWG